MISGEMRMRMMKMMRKGTIKRVSLTGCAPSGSSLLTSETRTRMGFWIKRRFASGSFQMTMTTATRRPNT